MSRQESSHTQSRAQAAPDAGGPGGPRADEAQAPQAAGDGRGAQPARAAVPGPGRPEPVGPAQDAISMRALSLRCDELQAQVTSLSSAAAIRADIIEEQIAHIGDLERHLKAVDALVADLQNQLGQGAAPATPSAAGLRSRAYWGLRRRAGGAVRRLLR
ncbi:hypothetical protein [Actinomyces bowdenii]|uniref:Uncharacterized protein n=1 Tax=Actinomyces bowdenii TaxID=131109 RepID=A0A3P1UT43_9ACTO|nr:hypothetical protein [Actinomyces bowdenii]RRD23663.1 hypothetical protein EII10_11835 [Actinomyces bowdenii]